MIIVVNKLVKYNLVFFGIFLVNILRDLFLLINCFFLEEEWLRKSWVCLLKVGEECGGWRENEVLLVWFFCVCMFIRLVEEIGFILMKGLIVLLVLIELVVWWKFEFFVIFLLLVILK